MSGSRESSTFYHTVPGLILLLLGAGIIFVSVTFALGTTDITRSALVTYVGFGSLVGGPLLLIGATLVWGSNKHISYILGFFTLLLPIFGFYLDFKEGFQLNTISIFYILLSMTSLSGSYLYYHKLHLEHNQKLIFRVLLGIVVLSVAAWIVVSSFEIGIVILSSSILATIIILYLFEISTAKNISKAKL